MCAQFFENNLCKKGIDASGVIIRMNYNSSFIFVKPKRTVDESFYYFITNSKVHLISDSSAFGFVFRCHFQKKEQKSPYFYLDNNGKSRDVIHIALKCLLVNDRIVSEKNAGDDDDYHYWEYTRLHADHRSKRHFDKKDRFEDEVRKQVDVSKRGIAKLNRNVPIVLFAKLFGDHSLRSKVLIRMLLHRCVSPECKHAIRQMLNELSYRQNIFESPLEYYLGVLAMEYIDTKYVLYNDIVKPIIVDDILTQPGNKNISRYDSLALSSYSDRLRWAYNTARYDLLRLAIDTGYSQGDYHTDNLLVNESSRKTMIIHFGKAEKIGDHGVMMQLWNKTTSPKLTWRERPDDLQLLLNIIYYSTFDESTEHTEFSWIKNIDEDDAEIMAFLHFSRTASLTNVSTRDIVETINDDSAFNGICTVDNYARIYAGSTMWSNILEYTIYGVFHTYFNCRGTHSSLNRPA